MSITIRGTVRNSSLREQEATKWLSPMDRHAILTFRVESVTGSGDVESMTLVTIELPEANQLVNDGDEVIARGKLDSHGVLRAYTLTNLVTNVTYEVKKAWIGLHLRVVQGGCVFAGLVLVVAVAFATMWWWQSLNFDRWRDDARKAGQEEFDRKAAKLRQEGEERFNQLRKNTNPTK